MKTTIRMCLAMLALLAPSRSEGADVPIPAALRSARMLGGFTTPAAWAGIWTYADTTYNCSPRFVRFSDAGTDTLCAGDSVEPDTTGGFQYNCTGTITDTQMDLVCTGSFALDTCTVDYTSTMHSTRTGDTVHSTGTFTFTVSPPGCGFIADDCFEFASHMTRVGPAPPQCGTPTERKSWGQLKSRYR